jgi:glycine/D-amino acid oxidase-like deaminating enzyme
MKRKEIVICGAGIAGISAAYHLAVKHQVQDIVIVDERPPLSLTSDKSTECYRNWWPGPGTAMVSLMNRSIDLLEDLAINNDNSFHLNRRGYLYLTGDEDKIPAILNSAKESSQLGAGQLRVYQGGSNEPDYSPAEAHGFSGSLSGADLILDRDLLRMQFPYVTEKAVAALHIRRAGWFSAQQFGSLLLGQAKAHGVQLIEGHVKNVEIENNRVTAVNLAGGERIPTQHFINAAGPFVKQVSESFGVELPVYCELHLKVSSQDHLKIIPRDAPMLIWNDAQKLPWSSEERGFLAEESDSQWLLGEFPPGVPPMDKDYPEIALRGLATMIPELKTYFDKPPRPFLDGGYYTKTRENRPLIGPLPVEGTWVIGALSGFGLMAAMAAGELLALHVLGKKLPAYSPAFELNRYQDPAYIELLDNWGDTGQL